MRVLLAAFIAAGLGCSRQPASPRSGAAAPDPVAVTIGAVESGPVQRYVRATGTLFGEEQAIVAAKVAGRIDSVWRDVGDPVAPGDPLARVDPRDYELAAEERRRAFEQALAQIGLSTKEFEALPEGSAPIDTLPAVEHARLQAENAKARFDRGRILHERTPPAMSDQDYADLRTAFEVAQADHRLARLTASAQLASARALLAQVATAEQRLADTLLRVPTGERPLLAGADASAPRSLDYVVTSRSVSVGDFVQIGAPLFELVDPDPLKLRVDVPERQAPRVHVGQRASVRVDTAPRAFEGHVSRVNFAVDTRTRTFEVEILLPNLDRLLRAGSFARAEIEAELQQDVPLVPRSAVTTFAGVNKVFGAKDGKAVERVVVLGQEVGDRVEIVKGVEPGAPIVLDPPRGLTGGTPIVAASAPASTPTGSAESGSSGTKR
jgi:multidrug efflux pump subunit AcrA (membrane-fusion protein)